MMHRKRGDLPEGFAGNDGRRNAGEHRASEGQARAGRHPKSARRVSAIAPVHYLRGETTLRTYRAQCAQYLRLYDRGRAEGLYGRGGEAETLQRRNP